MPITITLPGSPPGVVPWANVQAQSDFIGPFPSGTNWVVTAYTSTEPDPAFTILTITFPASSPSVGFSLQPIEGLQGNAWGGTTATEGQTVHVTTELQEPGNVVIDSGTVSGPWRPTDAIQLQPQGTGTGGGGLTDAQALQLSQTQASTYPTLLVDNLTLIPLTTGPETGPIDSGLLHFTFGVIVRIANVPPQLVPTTPDGDYWFPSLAVVRVFRGADLWLRVPVHTSNKIIPFVEESVVAGLAQVTGTLWLLNMSVQVTFREGVTGEVFLMEFP